MTRTEFRGASGDRSWDGPIAVAGAAEVDPDDSVAAVELDAEDLVAAQRTLIESVGPIYQAIDARNEELAAARAAELDRHAEAVSQLQVRDPGLSSMLSTAQGRAERIGPYRGVQLERIWEEERARAAAACDRPHPVALLTGTQGWSVQGNVPSNYHAWVGGACVCGLSLLLGSLLIVGWSPFRRRLLLLDAPYGALVTGLLIIGVCGVVGWGIRRTLLLRGPLENFKSGARLLGAAEASEKMRTESLEGAEHERHSATTAAQDLASSDALECATAEWEALRQRWVEVSSQAERAYPGWADGGTAVPGRVLRLGEVVTDHPLGRLAMPMLWSFRGDCQHLVLLDDEDGADLLVDLCAQLMHSPPNGGVEFELFDPTGLGRTFAMFSHLTDVGHGVARVAVSSTKESIAESLARIESHIETVNTSYLRGSFESLEAHNSATGFGVPYRIIVAHGLPTGVDADGFERLTRIARNGPPCGVHILCSWASDVELPYGVSAESLLHLFDCVFPEASATYEEDLSRGTNRRTRQISDHGFTTPGALSIEASGLIDTQIGEALGHTELGRVLLKFADSSIKRASAVISSADLLEVYDRAVAVNPERFPFAVSGVEASSVGTWWIQDSSHRITVPIGRKGATDFRALDLGGDLDGHHVLIGGTTGSGKSTLLHVMISGLSMLYGPDELRMYLLDMKDGVGFNIYGQHGGLPHADVLGVHCPPDFVLAALEGLVGEMHKRNELFSEETERTGRAIDDIAAYRASRGSKLPRVLCVIDEFQDLFAEDSRAENANRVLAEIAKKGRSAGIHLVLATQSYLSVGLAADTRAQFQTRIALRMSSADDSESLIGVGDAQDLYLKGSALVRGTGLEPCHIGYVDKDSDIPTLVRLGRSRYGGISTLRLFDGRRAPRLLDVPEARSRFGLGGTPRAQRARARADTPPGAVSA